jgi:translation initiation factor 2 beta subunit (eIF-2beta)/eIF-5
MNTIEDSCESVNDLDKEITAFNKFKFIEGYNSMNLNNFIILEPRLSEIHNLNGIYSFDNNKIKIYKESIIKEDTIISYITDLNSILEKIFPKPFPYLYTIYLNKLDQENIYVNQNSLSIFLSITISLLISIVIEFIRAQRHKNKHLEINKLEIDSYLIPLKINSEIKETIIKNLHEDLENIFRNIELKNKDHSHEKTEKTLKEVKAHIGRLITFGTTKRNDNEIDIPEEVNLMIDLNMNKILEKNIYLTQNYEKKTNLILQNKLKNFLILNTVINIFITNIPPMGKISVSIETDNENDTILKFSDNIPFQWKTFTPINDSKIESNIMLLSFDKLIYACSDEGIIAEHGNNGNGNFFHLKYRPIKNKKSNVINGNFK